MSICIIVARYNENVEWTKQFTNVRIYNKGTKLDNSYNEFFLNNVGREGHTYYKYICDNYENLTEYTIFLQGTPFDHSPNIISNVTKYINNKELSIDFEFLSEGIHYTSLDLERSRYRQCRNIHRDWERVFGVKIVGNPECIFGAGAQFIVSKKKILKNTKEFYENIVKMLEYDSDPAEGHVIERCHKYIFS
tara:strand:+ start:417 stop:992 length:576 start_codon:yes stop_codon:yes gene_type:complete